MTYEGLRLKILDWKRKLLKSKEAKKLSGTDFTIISNNCWGGTVYESYGLQKQTPTVGLFFFADDYIKFLKDVREYLEDQIIFIKPEESKWYEYIKNDPKTGRYPIGRIKDVEIFFLHYKTEQEVTEKWERRLKRINWNKIIVKFNDQNQCSKKNLEDFLELPYKNKIFFTVKDWGIESNEIVKIKQSFYKDCIKASYEPYYKSKYIDVTEFINGVINEK